MENKYIFLKEALWHPYVIYSISFNGIDESFKAYMYYQDGTGKLFYVKENDTEPKSFSGSNKVYIKVI